MRIVEENHLVCKVFLGFDKYGTCAVTQLHTPEDVNL